MTNEQAAAIAAAIMGLSDDSASFDENFELVLARLKGTKVEGFHKGDRVSYYMNGKTSPGRIVQRGTYRNQFIVKDEADGQEHTIYHTQLQKLGATTK